MNINLKSLFYFHEIVRFGGISKASQHLKQSQPNLSRAIKELEKELNEILMLRSKSGVRLTPKGEQVLSLAKKYVQTTEQINAELSDAVPDLRIGASENLILHVFPQILKKITKAQSVPVSLFSGISAQVENQLIHLDVDIGIFFHPPKSPELKRKVLGQVEFVLILPKGSNIKKISDVEAMPFIGSRKLDYEGAYFALDALVKKGITPRQMIETNSQEAQVRMVTEGLGYSLVPSFMVEQIRNRLTIFRPEIYSNLYLARRHVFFGEKAKSYDLIEKELKAFLKC